MNCFKISHCVVFLFVCLVFGCNSSTKNQDNPVEQSTENFDSDLPSIAITTLLEKYYPSFALPQDRKYALLVLPFGEGCGSCLKSAMDFMYEYADRPSIYYVVSTKGLEAIKWGPEDEKRIFSINGNEKNILFDSKAHILLEGQLGIYPKAFLIEGKTVTKVLTIDSPNINFTELLQFIE